MSYSVFQLDLLMDYPEYKDICKRFLSLAKDGETKEKLESILYRGGYKGYNPCGKIGKNNELIEINRRVNLAYLILRNPKTFDELVEKNIVYFHGTNANALPGILKYGLNSAARSDEMGIRVLTGEQWSQSHQKRTFISFTDVLNTAELYANLKGNIEENELSFPVIIGTTKENILNSDARIIKSDIPEVGVNNHFPKELIVSIMVPSSKVKFVKKMVGPNIIVLSDDDIEDRFYHIDDMYLLSIDEIKYKEFENGIRNKEYELSGIKETIYSRILSKIKQRVNAINELTRGETKKNERRVIK